MIYLIINDFVSENSYVRSKLSVNLLRNLFFEGKTLKGHLTEVLSSFEVKEIYEEFARESVFDSLEALARTEKKIKSNDIIFYLNIETFPAGKTEFVDMIERITYTEKPIICVTESTDKNIDWLVVPGKDLGEILEEKSLSSLEAKSIKLDIKDFTLDLQNPDDVVTLLNGKYQARYFNQLENDGVYIVKKSADKQKLKNEHEFLGTVPSHLRPYYPQVGEYRESPERSEYEIEKLYLFDCGKLLVNGTFNNEKNLTGFFEEIYKYISLAKKGVESKGFNVFYDAFVIEKNLKRKDMFAGLDHYETLKLVCQQNNFKDPESIIDVINSKIKELFHKSINDMMYFSHGDLCFSNILYDVQSKQLKLIDPRGDIKGHMGNIRSVYYDLAKLSHSIIGGYDYLASDFYEIKVREDLTYELVLYDGSRELDKAKNIFESFVSKLGLSMNFVRLMEASLFITMIPLHKDQPRRTIAQLLTVIGILKELEIKNGN